MESQEQWHKEDLRVHIDWNDLQKYIEGCITLCDHFDIDCVFSFDREARTFNWHVVIPPDREAEFKYLLKEMF